MGKDAIRQHSPRRLTALRTFSLSTLRNLIRRLEIRCWSRLSATKGQRHVLGIGTDLHRVALEDQVHRVVPDRGLLGLRQRCRPVGPPALVQVIDQRPPLCGVDPGQGDNCVVMGEDRGNPAAEFPGEAPLEERISQRREVGSHTAIPQGQARGPKPFGRYRRPVAVQSLVTFSFLHTNIGLRTVQNPPSGQRLRPGRARHREPSPTCFTTVARARCKIVVGNLLGVAGTRRVPSSLGRVGHAGGSAALLRGGRPLTPAMC